MARQKKSRKVGKIGIAKTPTNIRKPKEKRVKKPLGKPTGSRYNDALVEAPTANNKVNQDPRHGSKKPVSLVVEKKKEVKKVKYFSPKQELAAIEKDQRLSTLLDKIDIGKTISKEDQAFVDRTLTRHKELCDMLGVTEEPEQTHADTSIQQSDLYSEFDAIDINDFKD